ncbi:hypothetical protein SDC9_57720 [bioreactor metagenome]|uniref:YhfC family intramembrane metalloprotease n=1 Tax=bioreactor metagenome TaxID=1076179 RepID=A0A644X5Z8_9ZZZZ
MEYTVPTLSIVFMMVAALAGIAIPVGLYLYFRKRHGADRMPFWIGCIIFPVFALGLEQLAYLAMKHWGFWLNVQSNIFAYGAFAGMMAGLFEETGRYFGFAVLLRKKRGKDINGLMYGAGHGGIEAVLVMSLAMVSNLVFAFSVNAGTADPSMASIAAQLAGIAPVTFLVSIVERIGAVALHISLSVLVWFAVKNKKRFWLFPLAIVLHALVDAVAVIMSRFVSNIWLIEAAVYLLAGVCVVLAVIVYKRNSKPAEMAAEPAVEIA